MKTTWLVAWLFLLSIPALSQDAVTGVLTGVRVDLKKSVPHTVILKPMAGSPNKNPTVIKSLEHSVQISCSYKFLNLPPRASAPLLVCTFLLESPKSDIHDSGTGQGTITYHFADKTWFVGRSITNNLEEVDTSQLGNVLTSPVLVVSDGFTPVHITMSRVMLVQGTNILAQTNQGQAPRNHQLEAQFKIGTNRPVSF